MHSSGDLLPLKLRVRRANRMLFSALDNDLRGGREVEGGGRSEESGLHREEESSTRTELGNRKEVDCGRRKVVVRNERRMKVGCTGSRERTRRVMWV